MGLTAWFLPGGRAAAASAPLRCTAFKYCLLLSRFGTKRETSRPRQFLPQNAVKLPLRAAARVVSWNSENRSFESGGGGAERLLLNRLQVSEPTGDRVSHLW